MESSIFIQVLEYGEKVGLGGTTVKQFKAWAHENGLVNIETREPRNKLSIVSLTNLFFDCFQPVEVESAEREQDDSRRLYVLKTEYYFKLMDIRQFRETGAAVKSASRNAFIAMGITVLAIIVGAALIVPRLNTPVRIHNADLTALVNAVAPANVPAEVKLDSLQMAQVLSAVGAGAVRPEMDRKESLNPADGKEVSHHELINRYFEGEPRAVLNESSGN